MKRTTVIAIAMFLAVASGSAHADTVTDWNQTAIEIMKVAKVSANPWSRTLAMMHVAMSDAINSVQGRYTRYVATVPVVPGRQPMPPQHGGAADPAFSFFPSDAAYRGGICGIDQAIPEGMAKTQGVALGEQIAAAVQADRSVTARSS